MGKDKDEVKKRRDINGREEESRSKEVDDGGRRYHAEQGGR